jgi:hypothetical protein
MILGRTVQLSLFPLRALCLANVVSADVKLLCSLFGEPDNRGKMEGQYMYKRDIVTHSPLHCCRGKVVHIANTECVLSVALFTQHSKRVRCTVIYGLSHSAVFFDIIL